MEGEKESCLDMWKKEILFMYLVTIPAPFLSPEPEGTNNIGKMLWRTPGLLCPGSIHADLFQALVQG